MLRAAERSNRSRRAAAAFVAVAVAVAVSCGSCAPFSKEQARRYCAIMPDSVGLYVHNPVTQMGYPIGKVAAITPAALSVRVDFTIDDERSVPDDVKAVIRSTSILADRSLELVGNYDAGPKLATEGCIPLNRSLTPKSLSEVIGASTNFVDSINPAGSDNLGDVVSGLDQALRNQGPGANRLLTSTSAVLDSPGQAMGDLGSITKNLAQLTSTLADLQPTLKGVLSDADYIGPDFEKALWGGSTTLEGLIPIISALADLETQLGPQIQQLLDTVAIALRKASPRAPFYASLLNVAPRLINGLANLANTHDFLGNDSLRYRPPLYRLRTPDGVLQCNIMNASVPGSCANVNGTPYAVDVALLQYVLTQASR
jgi:phospholipid/cholesterol/gamma-HCH transport system substrate-binding protein